MPDRSLSSKKIKESVYESLKEPDWEDRFYRLLHLPRHKLISALFSALCSKERAVYWHSITCFGIIVPLIAQESLEEARRIMRRFMWSLNDESGGIGWGAPESMAEIMSCQKQLASEYHRILISFIQPRSGPDNYLEYEPLRQGAYWGIARLSQARPHLVSAHESLIKSRFCQESTPLSLGLICLALSWLKPGDKVVYNRLQELTLIHQPVDIYWNKTLQTARLSELAQKALENLSVRQD